MKKILVDFIIYRIIVPVVKYIGKKIWDWWKNRRRSASRWSKALGQLWRDRMKRHGR